MISMKNFILPLSFLVAGTAVFAQDAAQPAPAKPATHTQAPQTAHPATPAATHKHVAKTAVTSGEVVSTDAAQKTITFKNAKGEDLTWPVEGKAVASLAAVKAGEKVTIAYRANEQGEPQAATSIKAATAAKSHAKAPTKATPSK